MKIKVSEFITVSAKKWTYFNPMHTAHMIFYLSDASNCFSTSFQALLMIKHWLKGCCHNVLIVKLYDCIIEMLHHTTVTEMPTVR